MIDVLVISELATVRAGLAAVLGATEDLRVVGQGRSLAAEAVADLLPDVGVVLVDAPAPEAVDEALASLDGAGPGLVVLGPGGAAGQLLLSAPPFPWAFLAREAAPERDAAAVRAVAAGLVAFEAELAGPALARPDSAAPLPLGDTLDELTARERDVLTLVAVGLTNKAIALRLGISDTPSSSTWRPCWRSWAQRAAPRPCTWPPVAAC